jgi:diacylglycerol kinase family enzyme
MQETTSEQKNRLGELAYLWTAAKKAIKWQPHRFRLIIDGSGQTVEASELVLANIADVGLLGMRWGDQIAPDDGVLDVVAINVKKASEYVEVVTALARGTQANSSLFTYLSAHDRIRIETEHPLPIHGDGGEVEMSWPLEASLVPGALTVIVPSPDTA